jgi:hypothetical protein
MQIHTEPAWSSILPHRRIPLNRVKLNSAKSEDFGEVVSGLKEGDEGQAVALFFDSESQLRAAHRPDQTADRVEHAESRYSACTSR